MKSQTGQLARRATHAVMPIGGASATGARKTSFRGSTTFVPYKNEADDNSDDDEDSDFDDDTPAESIRPGLGGLSEKASAGGGGGASEGPQEGRNGEAEGDTERTPNGALMRSKSITSTTPREKK